MEIIDMYSMDGSCVVGWPLASSCSFRKALRRPGLYTLLTKNGREGTRVAEGVLKAMREEAKQEEEVGSGSGRGHGHGHGQELTSGL